MGASSAQLANVCITHLIVHVSEFVSRHACVYIHASDKRNGGQIMRTAQCMVGLCVLLAHGALATRNSAIGVVCMCVFVSEYTGVCIYTREGCACVCVCVCVYTYVEILK